MTGLRVVIILSMLMAFILAVASHKNHRLHSRQSDHRDSHYDKPCTTNPNLYAYFSPCSSTDSTSTSTTSTSSSADRDSSEEVDKTPNTNTDNTTHSTTSLERAHWCRFSNGSYLSLGASFIHRTCSICECTKSRLVFCKTLECMPTYCVDNKMPIRPTGECCTKCAYEPIAESCVYNNKSYPHGVILKSVEDKMQCWCQLGQIECRNYMVSLGNLTNDGAAVYIIVIVLIIVVVFGLLLCCGCTAGFYYYYQRHQQTFQQAYDEYVNSAGWQPMNDGEEFVADPTAEEKSIEAEKYQSSNGVSEDVPPPYATYNNAYVSEQEKK